MYREGYSQQNLNQFNPNVTNYSFHSGSSLKIPNTQTIPTPSTIIHHPPQNPPMYYEPQTSMMDQQGYPVMPMENTYEPRYYWREGIDPKPPMQNFQGQSQIMQPPNIVQRISSLIKSQLPSLQSVMAQVSTSYSLQKVQTRYKRSRSRQRSRSREKRPKAGHSQEWLCHKCSFSNYEWRDRCKKCNELRSNRGFVPGPQDWKCPKCLNINYARRNQCNRCKRPRYGD